MPPPFGRSFRYRDVAAVHVEADDARVLDWLAEFLCPWFETAEGDAALRVTVRHRTDDRLHAELGRTCPLDAAQPAAAFALDTQTIRLPSWIVDGRRVLLDAARDCWIVVEGTRVELVAPTTSVRARLTLMRVVREIVTARARRVPGALELHAAACERDGEAVLLAGPKRSGKTTLLVHALLKQGARFLANDRLFVFDAGGGREAPHRAGTVAAPEVAGMPTIVTLQAGTLTRYPRLAAAFPAHERCALWTVAEMRAELAARGPWRPDGPLHLSPAELTTGARVASVAGARVRAIVFPTITPDVPTFETVPLTAAEARDRLRGALYGLGVERDAPTVFATLGGDGPADPPDAAIARLAATVPCYACRLGPDAYRRPPDPGPLTAILGE